MKNIFHSRVIIYGLGSEFHRQHEFLSFFFCIVGYSDRRNIDVERFIDRNNINMYNYEYIYITSAKYEYGIRNELSSLLNIRDEKFISTKDIWEYMVTYMMSGKSDYHIQTDNGITDILSYKYKIYTPAYNSEVLINTDTEPEIYNKNGEHIKSFFIRDSNISHTPYFMNNKYFIWDRYNYGLSTHFYSHKAMLETMGAPIHKYAILFEPRSITPDDYQMIINNSLLRDEFDLIFTFDDEILEKISTARLLPIAGSWYGRNNPVLADRQDNYLYKEKNISILASNKDFCEMHRLRKALAIKCNREGLADAFGMSVGKYAEIEEPYEKYRFSIIIENFVSSYYFSEKLTTCIEAQTIPIYLGAKKIEEFFNIDGIVVINKEDIDNIEGILSMCNKEYYDEHIPAIIDNYNRVKKYNNPGEYLYEKYLL